jgi:hypothetical protein
VRRNLELSYLSPPGFKHFDAMRSPHKIATKRNNDLSLCRRARLGWLALAACAGVLVAAASAGLLRVHAETPSGQSTTAQAPSPQAVAEQSASTAGQIAQPAGDKATDAQQRHIASECADLLKMANALKSAVDKTTKDQLSVTVVRKANEIEQLAHKARTGTPKG